MNKNKKRTALILILLGIIILNAYPSFGANWYKGTLHTHTGFSTYSGYDGNPDTDEDDCLLELVTIYDYYFHNQPGKNISQLKQQALGLGLKWQSFEDHSYCLDSSEFQTVKTDCINAQQNGTYTCLAGEELSVYDGLFDKESLCFNEVFKSGAHIGANGISSYQSQSPTGIFPISYCPISPTAQNATRKFASLTKN